MSSELLTVQSQLSKVEGRNNTLEKQVCLVARVCGAEKVNSVSCKCVHNYFLPLQVRDLNTKIEELEAVGGRKLKSQVAALESKIIGLEDQLDSANK